MVARTADGPGEVAPAGAGLLPMLAVLGVGGLLIHALIGVLLIDWLIQGHALGDYRAFYMAGEIVAGADRASLYDLDFQTQVQHRLFGVGPIDAFPLPPFAAFVFVPFATVPYTASYLAWLACNLLMFSAFAAVAWQSLRQAPLAYRAAALICAAGATPLFQALFLGQVDLVVLLSVTGSWLLLRRDQPIAAGSVLALGLIKPHLIAGVVIMLAVKGEWRALGALAVCAALLVAGPAAVLGPSSIADQATFIARTPESFSPATMANLRGLLAAVTRTDTPAIWFLPTAAVALTGLAVSTRAWRTLSATSPQGWAIAVSWALMSSPHLHVASLVIAGLPVLQLAVASAGTGKPATHRL
jgi:hypothetical protein